MSASIAQKIKIFRFGREVKTEKIDEELNSWLEANAIVIDRIDTAVLYEATLVIIVTYKPNFKPKF